MAPPSPPTFIDNALRPRPHAAGTRPHEGLPGSPRVPAWGWWGQPRAAEDVRACVRGAWERESPRGGPAGGAHEARRAGQRERTASSRPGPPARAPRVVQPGPRLIVLVSRRPKMAAALEALGL
ncbi:unnamed protein product [Rangifer tarandus platyrhynchus]|uniref:Uncharacterized protein n=1 Tax=Rangifer tarandus platyrhynchus TaxID=3082113 RepID=A0ABN8Z8N2_RANTA|nr:unnamed protein product [Rangifer tarandus platyrhynchus]CAI9688497.1 unnamed protein product [Rangifer tarandus platyrhynchus]